MSNPTQGTFLRPCPDCNPPLLKLTVKRPLTSACVLAVLPLAASERGSSVMQGARGKSRPMPHAGSRGRSEPHPPFSPYSSRRTGGVCEERQRQDAHFRGKDRREIGDNDDGKCAPMKGIGHCMTKIQP